jgi:hypothetical protein
MSATLSNAPQIYDDRSLELDAAGRTKQKRRKSEAQEVDTAPGENMRTSLICLVLAVAFRLVFEVALQIFR